MSTVGDGGEKLLNLEARAFADSILLGPCPRCGSDNAHSCEYDSDIVECDVARAIDAIDIGHCESCGCLFCAECRHVIRGADKKALSDLPKAVMAHWKTCPELKPGRSAQKYGFFTSWSQ